MFRRKEHGSAGSVQSNDSGYESDAARNTPAEPVFNLQCVSQMCERCAYDFLFNQEHDLGVRLAYTTDPTVLTALHHSQFTGTVGQIHQQLAAFLTTTAFCQPTGRPPAQRPFPLDAEGHLTRGHHKRVLVALHLWSVDSPQIKVSFNWLTAGRAESEENDPSWTTWLYRVAHKIIAL